MSKKIKTISLESIQQLLDASASDVEKFNNGVNAPGSRIRKVLQGIKLLCAQLRKDVTDIKNGRK